MHNLINRGNVILSKYIPLAIFIQSALSTIFSKLIYIYYSIEQFVYLTELDVSFNLIKEKEGILSYLLKLKKIVKFDSRNNLFNSQYSARSQTEGKNIRCAMIYHFSQTIKEIDGEEIKNDERIDTQTFYTTLDSKNNTRLFKLTETLDTQLLNIQDVIQSAKRELAKHDVDRNLIPPLPSPSTCVRKRVEEEASAPLCPAELQYPSEKARLRYERCPVEDIQKRNEGVSNKATRFVYNLEPLISDETSIDKGTISKRTWLNPVESKPRLDISDVSEINFETENNDKLKCDIQTIGKKVNPELLTALTGEVKKAFREELEELKTNINEQLQDMKNESCILHQTLENQTLALKSLPEKKTEENAKTVHRLRDKLNKVIRILNREKQRRGIYGAQKELYDTKVRHMQAKIALIESQIQPNNFASVSEANHSKSTVNNSAYNCPEISSSIFEKSPAHIVKNFNMEDYKRVICQVFRKHAKDKDLISGSTVNVLIRDLMQAFESIPENNCPNRSLRQISTESQWGEITKALFSENEKRYLKQKYHEFPEKERHIKLKEEENKILAQHAYADLLKITSEKNETDNYINLAKVVGLSVSESGNKHSIKIFLENFLECCKALLDKDGLIKLKECIHSINGNNPRHKKKSRSISVHHKINNGLEQNIHYAEDSTKDEINDLFSSEYSLSPKWKLPKKLSDIIVDITRQSVQNGGLSLSTVLLECGVPRESIESTQEEIHTFGYRGRRSMDLKRQSTKDIR